MVKLLYDLREFVRDTLAELSLESKDRGGLPPVRVYIGELPGDAGAPPASDFPLALIRLASFEDGTGDLSSVTVRIIVGTYAPEDDTGEPCSPGYHDVLNMLERLRQAFLRMSTFKRAWRREGKVEGGPFDYQEYPYFFGDILVTFNKRAVTEELEPGKEIDVFGTAYGNERTRNWEC